MAAVQSGRHGRPLPPAKSSLRPTSIHDPSPESDLNRPQNAVYTTAGEVPLRNLTPVTRIEYRITGPHDAGGRVRKCVDHWLKNVRASYRCTISSFFVSPRAGYPELGWSEAEASCSFFFFAIIIDHSRFLSNHLKRGRLLPTSMSAVFSRKASLPLLAFLSTSLLLFFAYNGAERPHEGRFRYPDIPPPGASDSDRVHYSKSTNLLPPLTPNP